MWWDFVFPSYPVLLLYMAQNAARGVYPLLISTRLAMCIMIPFLVILGVYLLLPPHAVPSFVGPPLALLEPIPQFIMPPLRQSPLYLM